MQFCEVFTSSAILSSSFFFLFFFLSTGGEEGEGAGLVVLDVTSQLNHGKVNIASNLALPNDIQSESNA